MANEGKRSYRPGHRRKDLPGEKKRLESGMLSEGRWAWCKTNLGQFVILVDEDKSGESGPNIKLYHPAFNRRPIAWHLTNLTEQELLAMKDLFDSAFEWALPIVRLRDKEAADAFKEGDDSYARVYRALPQLVYRKRPEREHDEGVLWGSEGISEGHGRANSGAGYAGAGESEGRDGGVREPGDGVAEPNEKGSSAPNNWPTPHIPPKLR